jgi:hypothetical protein
MEAPPFDPAYLPADPALFDLLSGESRWDFDCGTLSGAARDAGIGILEGSVLPISWDGASEAFEAVAGVSPSQWVAELAALAEPGWQVHVRGASLLGRHSVTYSIAKREPHAWVRTEDGASGCRVTVGVGPESAYRLALRSILELGVDGQADQFIEIGAADVARLLGSAAGQAGVVSDALAALRLPEPSSPPADSLDPLGLYAPQAFARALHGARAAVTVVSTAFSDGRRVSTGMAAIGTASGSWIIAPALPWSDAIPADAPVFLYSTTNKLLRASVAKAVGLPGPPVLEGPL